MANASGQIREVSFSERRICSRKPLRSLSYVELGEGNGGIILNVSEGGLAVQAALGLMADSLPRMRFQLPHSKNWVETSARVAWTNSSRKVAGLQFLNLTEQAGNYIHDWLSLEGSQAEPAEQPAEEPSPRNSEPAAAPPSNGRNSQTSRPAPVVAPQVISRAPDEPASSPSIAAPPDPPPLYLFGRGFDYSLDRNTPRPDGAFIDDSHSRGLWVFVILVISLAIISLGAGWAAGRGTMNDFLARFRAISAPPVPAVVQGAPTSLPVSPAPQISQIQVIDTENRRWTIPFQTGASTTPDRTAHHEASRAHDWATFETPITSPDTTQHSTDASSQERAVPSPVAPPASTAGVPPSNESAASSDFPPPSAASPPQAQVGALQRGALVYHIDPVYPQIAVQQKIEGTVKLRVTIGPDGAVRTVFVISGPGLLIEAARSAVRQWRYRPTLLDGKPVESEEYVSIEFRLPPSLSAEPPPSP
jgi:TonB family protein